MQNLALHPVDLLEVPIGLRLFLGSSGWLPLPLHHFPASLLLVLSHKLAKDALNPSLHVPVNDVKYEHHCYWSQYGLLKDATCPLEWWIIDCSPLNATKVCWKATSNEDNLYPFLLLFEYAGFISVYHSVILKVVEKMSFSIMDRQIKYNCWCDVLLFLCSVRARGDLMCLTLLQAEKVERSDHSFPSAFSVFSPEEAEQCAAEQCVSPQGV